MEDPAPSDAAKKAKAIRAFNKAVQSSAHFEARRKAKTSATVFFDSGPKSVLSFRQSSQSWCRVPDDMVDYLATSAGSNRITRFQNADEGRHHRRQTQLDASQTEAPHYLKLAMALYLECHLDLAKSYQLENMLRVTTEVALLQAELKDHFHDLMSEPSIVAYIKHRLFRQRTVPKVQPASELFLIPRKRSDAEVLRLKDEGKYSIKDICTLSKISQSKYYDICKRKKYSEEHYEEVKTQPRLRGGLSGEHIDYIKKLADDPSRSCTVPDMCQEMKREFSLDVSKKTVYYHLTHTLGYSYQRNHFKPMTAFQPGQKFVNYKVCKTLIGFQGEHKNIICMDESGFHLGVQKEYSYAKRCQHPFRVSRQSVSKLHIIMAISQRNIFAYQARMEGHNEHSFIAFILDLTRKIHELGAAFESNTVLFLDNAPFHTSHNAMTLLKMLPFPVFFNAANWSDLNPIESVFSIIKARLKKLNPRNR